MSTRILAPDRRKPEGGLGGLDDKFSKAEYKQMMRQREKERQQRAKQPRTAGRKSR